MSSTNQIRRMTLYKIPKPEDQEKLLEIYKTMPQDAQKDGKPYILSVDADRAYGAQGYTVAITTVFSSEEDVVYYDKECKAHEKLKGVTEGMHQGVKVVDFESVPDSSNGEDLSSCQSSKERDLDTNE